MTRNWTKAQKDAIEARDGTLLVSAAAGSGKTAVLVERVIERICDEKKPCDADRLLLVTFTKAAAAEMRERISAALSDRLRRAPDDAYLQRQTLLLGQAGICTIDSFCNDLVRENFHRLEIAPDYQILEGSELTLLQEEACAAALEELYAQNDPAFAALVELLSVGRDDAQLVQAIERLYTYTQAYPFPEEWLGRVRGAYQEHVPLAQSAWGATILRYIGDAAAYAAGLLRQAIRRMEAAPELAAAYGPALEDGCARLDAIGSLVRAGEWNSLKAALASFVFGRFSPAPKAYRDDPLKAEVTARRDTVKKLIPKLSGLLCATQAEHEEDRAALAPLVAKLIEAVTVYGKQLDRRKAERRALDFSDLEHLALSLLVTNDEAGDLVYTPLARELAGRYEEILVDEYQDTNEAQDLLFQAISRNGENLFFVGDVKQSIYRFRQAMPEIFLHRRDALALYSPGRYPARINLDRNFRSRAGVTGAVNFIFRQLMSRELGELDYDESEQLVPAADYAPAGVPDAELHLLDADERGEDMTSDAFEAAYLARLIQGMLADGLTVREGDGVRPARYRDFCILLRGVRHHAGAYIEALRQAGVPAWADLSGGFFGAPEVQVMLALLRVLDNPMQDVPLLALLFSPIYGFTPDEVAQIRSSLRHAPFYHALLRAAEEGNEKCAAFLAQLARLRRLSATLPADELLRRLYDETGYPDLVCAMPDGGQREANLRLLLEYADRYEQAGYQGLSGLIRLIDRLEEQNADFSPASPLSEAADVVRVMSIHKSKGLEFPVCILAGCAAPLSTASRKGNMLLHPQLGVGLVRRDMETLRQFPTVGYRAVQLATQQAELSEELRVLYVALTRAKERLITVMSVKHLDQKLAGLAADLGKEERIAPFAVRKAGSYADWLLSAALRHPDGAALRARAGCAVPVLQDAGFSWKIVVAGKSRQTEREMAAVAPEPPASDGACMEEINTRLSYRYPYAELAPIAAKRAASELTRQGMDRQHIAAARPAFLSEKGLTPAQRGTATHLFMQFADYRRATASPREECALLAARGFLSAQEAASVDLQAIARFFTSALAARIFASPQVMREVKFTFEIPACEMENGLPPALREERVLVQGIADCAFVEDGQLVIVDYKTDRAASPEALAARYAGQLRVYKRALAQCTGYRVKETCLYAFALNQEIPVE